MICEETEKKKQFKSVDCRYMFFIVFIVVVLSLFNTRSNERLFFSSFWVYPWLWVAVQFKLRSNNRRVNKKKYTQTRGTRRTKDEETRTKTSPWKKNGKYDKQEKTKCSKCMLHIAIWTTISLKWNPDKRLTFKWKVLSAHF